MSLFRSLIRALATSGELFSDQAGLRLTPHEFLNRLVSFTNQYVCDIHGDSGLFTTLFIFLLEPGSGKLTYLNAGNEPPFWHGKDQSNRELRPTGPVIGIIPEAVFNTQEIVLQLGDTLCTFTDGVTDALNNQDVVFGRERLLRTIQDSPPVPNLMIDSVVKELEHFAGSTAQFDDITLLVVRKI
jgi:sigma-B regulation protein RsbU (phosphoserine phosphatase)